MDGSIVAKLVRLLGERRMGREVRSQRLWGRRLLRQALTRTLCVLRGFAAYHPAAPLAGYPPLRWAACVERICWECQFSPGMGPPIFGQDGPLGAMTLVRFQAENHLTKGVH